MIVLGRIVAPHGVRGWVKIHPFGDDPLSWRKMRRWWLGRDPDSLREADWQAFELRALKPQGKILVASLGGVADRGAAEAVDGMYIAAPREALPAPDQDEFYWADLVGLAVENLGGVALGRVEALIETGAHAVLQIRDGERERLIPFVAAVVQEVDLPARRIRADWGEDW